VSTVADIRTAIVTRMNAVSGIGVVHAYERYAADLKTLALLYSAGAGQPIKGWFVRRALTQETGNVQGRTIERIRWRIQGVMSLDDAAASELTFDALIEGVRNAFAADETLGDAAITCINGDGESCIQLDDAGPVMFGGVLCHAARLGLNTIRYLERNP
jgi:hypothetical protein